MWKQTGVHAACYDLLGTESRTAVFCAIAKEDVPQESWFLLGAHIRWTAAASAAFMDRNSI